MSPENVTRAKDVTLAAASASLARSHGCEGHYALRTMVLIGAIFLAVFVLPQPWGVVAVAAALTIEVAEAAFWVWLSKRRRAQVGAEALVGALAEVVTPCRPDGNVRVQGELWRARCEPGADVGERVRVRALDGLTLLVDPA
jgi:membrane protein implicated in regulation of membrane protease activity